MSEYVEGKPCKKCGGTARYAPKSRGEKGKMGDCVQCGRERNTRKKVRLMELSSGEAKYIGDECQRCGLRDRYTANGNCIFCNIKDLSARSKKRKLENPGICVIQGKSCNRCGGNTRYVSDMNCVRCNSDNGKSRRQSIKAAYAGKIFHGIPCRKCEGIERYVSGGSCVYCSLERGKEYARKKPEFLRSVKRKSQAKRYRESELVRSKQRSASEARRSRYKEACQIVMESDIKLRFEELGNKCLYCKASDKKLTIDHLIAMKKGGIHRISNIVPACNKCNASKNDESVFTWYYKQYFYDPETEDLITKIYYNEVFVIGNSSTSTT